MLDLPARAVALLERLLLVVERVEQRLEREPLRGVGPEDLLTVDEVARYIHLRRAEVQGWLDQQQVPRALSPGGEKGRRIALYRACDVRRALEAAAAIDDEDAWDRLGA